MQLQSYFNTSVGCCCCFLRGGGGGGGGASAVRGQYFCGLGGVHLSQRTAPLWVGGGASAVRGQHFCGLGGGVHLQRTAPLWVGGGGVHLQSEDSTSVGLGGGVHLQSEDSTSVGRGVGGCILVIGQYLCGLGGCICSQRTAPLWVGGGGAHLQSEDSTSRLGGGGASAVRGRHLCRSQNVLKSVTFYRLLPGRDIKIHVGNKQDQETLPKLAGYHLVSQRVDC